MKSLIIAYFIFLPFYISAQINQEKIIYLLPGQGSDERLFKNIHIEHYETKSIKYIIPEKGENMASYAKKLSAQIDTTARYSIIGVSLGGMLAIEIAKIMQPEEVILIASAKTKNEIPALYLFFQKIPIHRLLGGRFYKFWTILLQPLYEPMDKADQKLWRKMMKEKNPKFMKRAVRCIVEWDNENYTGIKLLHIHGNKDRTLPIKNIHEPVVVENGTHVMTLTKGEEISFIINQWLTY
ncbi:MAG: alpha/beta hydrolase [Saprospiraceae bacterium]